MEQMSVKSRLIQWAAQLVAMIRGYFAETSRAALRFAAALSIQICTHREGPTVSMAFTKRAAIQDPAWQQHCKIDRQNNIHVH